MDYEKWQCENCGEVYTDEQPDEEQTHAGYDGKITLLFCDSCTVNSYF